jgi:hypothetical protein
MSPRNSRITFHARDSERGGIKSHHFPSLDFLGNQPTVGTSHSELDEEFFMVPSWFDHVKALQ